MEKYWKAIAMYNNTRRPLDPQRRLRASGRGSVREARWRRRLIHVDVMDGISCPTSHIGPPVVKAFRPHIAMPFDVHLMIAPVDPFVAAFAEAGADIITFHPEAGPHLHRSRSSSSSGQEGRCLAQSGDAACAAG